MKGFGWEWKERRRTKERRNNYKEKKGGEVGLAEWYGMWKGRK